MLNYLTKKGNVRVKNLTEIFGFLIFLCYPWGFSPYIAKIYQVICQNYLFTYFLVRGVTVKLWKTTSLTTSIDLLLSPLLFRSAEQKFLIEFVNKPRKQSWKLKKRSLFPYKLNSQEICRWDVSSTGAKQGRI